MKRSSYILVIGSFILVIGVPFSWMYVMPALNVENQENRKLASKPDLSIAAMDKFPKAFEEYLTDHLPYKSQFVYLNSHINMKLFQELDSSEVIAGENNWLFYKRLNDGSTLKDYKHIDLFTAQELEKIKNNLLALKKQVESMGSKFILMIPPNKENIYSELMPDYMKRIDDISRVEQLIDYLNEQTDIEIVYPAKELLEAKIKYPVYYQTDTHWNKIGSYIGISELLKTLDISSPPLNELTVLRTKYIKGDLNKLVNLGKNYNSIEYKLSGLKLSSVIDKTTIEDAAVKAKRYECPTAVDIKIYIAGDSFSDNMVEYINPLFRYSVIQNRYSLNMDMVQNEVPDYFVYEIVERLLEQLIISV